MNAKIIDYTGTKTRQLPVSYGCKSIHFLKELSTPTLNGIVVSAWYVSLALASARHKVKHACDSRDFFQELFTPTLN